MNEATFDEGTTCHLCGREFKSVQARRGHMSQHLEVGSAPLDPAEALARAVDARGRARIVSWSGVPLAEHVSCGQVVGVRKFVSMMRRMTA